MQVTANGGYTVAESFDGRWLYYAKDSNSITTIWRRSLTGEPEDAPVIDKVRRWFAPGRNGLYFNPLGAKQILYWDATSRATRTAAELPYPLFLGVAVSPDERELCGALGKPGIQDLMMFENFR